MLSNYSNEDYNLTKKETAFIKMFLNENGCAAVSPENLLCDNFSCQCIEDIREWSSLSANVVGGLLSSLQEKGVLMYEERGGAICKSTNYATQMNFEPDLYWVEDCYLESLDPELEFGV